MGERILITGIAGGLAQLVAQELLGRGNEIVGVDYRPRPAELVREITFHQANYNKTGIEDVFRRNPPKAVLHLGRVGNLKMVAGKRFDLNVVGSTKVLEQCLRHGVEKLVVLSTFHIYGAHPANHVPITEEEPLRAGQSFPQLADAVQLDNQAVQWVYQHPQLHTVVLRPTNVVGPHVSNAMSQYLRQRTQIYLAGFNPMWQFVHERDMARAILLAFDGKATGVYNVAGAGELPLAKALELTGAHVLPVPDFVASTYLRLRGRFVPALPAYFLDFFKYPCVISDAKFRKDFGYAPEMGLVQTIESV
jgi:UDP-glucose 4-epimerase